MIGDECIIFNDGESNEKFDDVVKKFENHCLPLSNEVFECFKFLSCSQKDRQAIDVYDVCTELKTLASSCGFGDQKSSLLQDQIVLGIWDKDLQERLLWESDFTLKKAVDSIQACKINDPKCSKVNVYQKKKVTNFKHPSDCKSCERY